MGFSSVFIHEMDFRHTPIRHSSSNMCAEHLKDAPFDAQGRGRSSFYVGRGYFFKNPLINPHKKVMICRAEILFRRDSIAHVENQMVRPSVAYRWFFVLYCIAKLKLGI